MSSNSSNDSSSSDHGEQRPVLEGPEYRSVMIAGPSSPALPRPFALAPPPLPSKFTSPSAKTFAKSTTLQQQPHQPHHWKIVELPLLPAGYLLERTNVCVQDTSAPQVVADRICECLRELSIAAKTSSGLGDSDETNEESLSKNVLYAETEDSTKFAVRLFRDIHETVVVEVQRTMGCSFRFREASRAVLRSAKGLPPLPARKRFTMPSSLPARPVAVRQECVRDDFDIAYHMLQSERSDARALALESLEQMTDDSSSSCAAVEVAAKSVLSCQCVKQLLGFLMATEEDTTWHSETAPPSVLRRKVLGILANACAALGQADLAEILSVHDNELKNRSFLSVLLASLRDASSEPHDAYQAVRCLQSLVVSKEVEDAMFEMRAMELVESACDAGTSQHKALENESQKLMGQLRKIC